MTWTAKQLLGEAILWLREEWPESVIIPELSVGHWGTARIDVCAVTPTELIGVEIKGEGDSASRLRLQGMTYSSVCSRMFLLPSPGLRKQCLKAKPPGWLMATREDGEFWSASDHRGDYQPGFDQDFRPMPTSAIRLVDMLWADEIRYLFNAHDCKLPPDALLVRDKRAGKPKAWAIAEQVPMGKLQPSIYRILYRRRWEAGTYAKQVWRPDAAVNR